MAIGRTIAIKGFATQVEQNRMCASACGLAWLAGRPRLLYASSQVGFHAVYQVHEQRLDVSSVGNALVGGYLRDLGLSTAVVVYVTQAQPNSMRWLTRQDAVEIGLDVGWQETPIAEVEVSNIPVPETAPRVSDREEGAQVAYLYEEQPGGPPVTIPGSVSWSLKTHTTSAGEKLHIITAKVDVPARHMSVTISFRRNTDASLPASHVVDFEFDLPLAYREGSVEKIHRISLKRTEEERGTNLIAVPVKISSRFHMVALNGDADAEKRNVELVKTLPWFDIPISYTNNRRALLTLEKGQTGQDAFDQVFAWWQLQ